MSCVAHLPPSGRQLELALHFELYLRDAETPVLQAAHSVGANPGGGVVPCSVSGTCSSSLSESGHTRLCITTPATSCDSTVHMQNWQVQAKHSVNDAAQHTL